MYRSRGLFIGAAMLWVMVTLGFFVLDSTASSRPPIAEGALASLLTAYLPVLVLCVFLLLYLTRKRSPIEWASDFHVNIERARPELWLVCAYLLITQIGLGYFWNTGLHFPGPEIYERNTHLWHDVVSWMLLNGVFYIVIPIYWLRRTGLRAADLFRSMEWRRNAWIIAAYWALDFFRAHHWWRQLFLFKRATICSGRSDQHRGQYHRCRVTGRATDARDIDTPPHGAF